jgi:hypothetical protein
MTRKIASYAADGALAEGTASRLENTRKSAA